MALTPLESAQSQAVNALVTAHRLEQVPVDLRRARNQQRYEARSVGGADAEVANRAARALYAGAAARGI